jgi:hypothetical protein
MLPRCIVISYTTCVYILLKGLTEDKISDYSDDIEISHDAHGLLTISLCRQGDESEDRDDNNSSVWTVGAHKISTAEKQGHHDVARGFIFGAENETDHRPKSVIKKRYIFDMHEVVVDSSSSVFVIWTDIDDEIPGNRRSRR